MVKFSNSYSCVRDWKVVSCKVRNVAAVFIPACGQQQFYV